MEQGGVANIEMGRQSLDKPQKKFNQEVVRSSSRENENVNCSKQYSLKQSQRSMSKQRQGEGNKNYANLSHEQKLKIRKYDYLNKYNQHELLRQTFEKSLNSENQKRQNTNLNSQSLQQKLRNQKQKYIDTRKNRFERFSNQQKKNNHQTICSSLQFKNAHDQVKSKLNHLLIASRSKSRSPSSNHSQRQFKPILPHFQYLQAYKNNILSPDSFNASKHYSSAYASPTKPRLAMCVVHPTFAEQEGLNSTKKSLKQALTRIPGISNGLGAEISRQNELYRGQVNEYRRLVAKLQIDLTNVRQQVLKLKQRYGDEKQYYEQIISRYKQEVNTLAGYKQRYEILNKEMLQLNKNQATEEAYSFQNVTNRSFGKNNTPKEISSKQEEKKIILSVQNALVKQMQALLQSKNSNSPTGTNKENNYGLGQGLQQMLLRVQKIIKANKKHEDLLFNIGQMHKKIQKSQCQRLNSKELWKWLKYIGSIYSFIVEIKPLLCSKIGISEVQSSGTDIKKILEMILIHT